MKLSPVTKSQWLDILKAALYLGVSTVIGYFITLTTNQPDLLGIYTPIVNVVLVFLKKLFTVAPEQG